MIKNVTGDLLEADVDALVNTVNTVGVMGKGIALQFKQAYPANFKAYAKACKAEEVQPGSMFMFDNGHLEQPKFIINFPTKRHWRSKSRIDDIKSGLVDLARVVRELQIQSIALPPLDAAMVGSTGTTLSHSLLRPSRIFLMSKCTCLARLVHLERPTCWSAPSDLP